MKVKFSTLIKAALLSIFMISPISYVSASFNTASFEQPEQEALYQELIKKFRCLVCQNQNLADSNATLANDLKQIIQDQILAGQNDAQISAFLTERYGDFVLYDPPFKPSTWVLWIAPALFLLIGLIIVLLYLRRMRPDDKPQHND